MLFLSSLRFPPPPPPTHLFLPNVSHLVRPCRRQQLSELWMRPCTSPHDAWDEVEARRCKGGDGVKGMILKCRGLSVK